MQTMQQALYEAVTGGDVELQEAMRMAASPQDFKLLVNNGGSVAPLIDDLYPTAEPAAGAVTG
jgi:Tfp pilus assembly ATPase PilU